MQSVEATVTHSCLPVGKGVSGLVTIALRFSTQHSQDVSPTGFFRGLYRCGT